MKNFVWQMVTARISQEDAKEKGWLLDGFPRTFAQAQSLEKLKIRPDVYIVLDVCDSHVCAINFQSSGTAQNLLNQLASSKYTYGLLKDFMIC